MNEKSTMPLPVNGRATRDRLRFQRRPTTSRPVSFARALVENIIDRRLTVNETGRLVVGRRWNRRRSLVARSFAGSGLVDFSFITAAYIPTRYSSLELRSTAIH